MSNEEGSPQLSALCARGNRQMQQTPTHVHAERLVCSGAIPSARYAHTAVLAQDTMRSARNGNPKMLVFGGFTNHFENDFFEFDLVTQTWLKLEDTDIHKNPQPRANHTAVLRYLKDPTTRQDMQPWKLVIFGGMDRYVGIWGIWGIWKYVINVVQMCGM